MSILDWRTILYTSVHLGPCDEAGGDGRVDVAARHVSQALGQRGYSHPEAESDPHILGLGNFDFCSYIILSPLHHNLLGKGVIIIPSHAAAASDQNLQKYLSSDKKYLNSKD